MRTSGDEKDTGGGSLRGPGVGEVGPWGTQEGVLGGERMVSHLGPGGLSRLRGNTKFKHSKILRKVVGAIKIVRSPEAT